MRRFSPDPVDQEPLRGCDQPGCDGHGVHRAPRARDLLDSYYWFCLEHVRSYNSAWNFFADMNQREIEDYLHADLTWHRPTWPLSGTMRMAGGIGRGRMGRDHGVNDPFGIFGAHGDEADGPADQEPRRSAAGEREALAILNLPAQSTVSEIKARFKALVKRLHPDVNGGDRQAEDQLKIVIEAYRLLSGRQAA